MKISDCNLRSIALVLAVLFAAQFAAAAPSQQQQVVSNPQLQGTPTSTTEPQDSDTPNAPRPQDAVQDGQANASQSTSNSSQSTTSEQHPNPPSPSQPVGTAAAPYEKPAGVAASRPSGAVIAPGKQRREHAIVIRIAIVVGAAIAVGTVAALSRSSSGRP